MIVLEKPLTRPSSALRLLLGFNQCFILSTTETSSKRYEEIIELQCRLQNFIQIDIYV